MPNALRLLYLIKDSPFEPRSHSSQRAHALIGAWNLSQEASVLFFFPGKTTKSHVLKATPGFEVKAQRTLIEKIKGIFFSYHFRLIGSSFQKEVLRLSQGQKFDAVVAEELTMAEHAIPIAKALGVPIFYIAHNFEAKLYSQIGSGKLRFIKLMVLKWKEASILKSVTRAFAFSKVDAVRMQTSYSGLEIKTTSAGFDLDSTVFTERRADRRHLLIIGALDYLPNIESVVWFASQIYPLLKTPYPVIVAGRNPSSQVKEVCTKAGFELVPSPKDMNPILNRGVLEVVPLKKGSGTRGKILEAMAAGLPIVSTELGCEGLGLEHGKHLLVADTAIEFAKAVEQLMDNEAQRHHLAKEAFSKVKDYSYHVVAKALIQEIKTDL